MRENRHHISTDPAQHVFQGAFAEEWPGRRAWLRPLSRDIASLTSSSSSPRSRHPRGTSASTTPEAVQSAHIGCCSYPGSVPCAGHGPMKACRILAPPLLYHVQRRSLDRRVGKNNRGGVGINAEGSIIVQRERRQRTIVGNVQQEVPVLVEENRDTGIHGQVRPVFTGPNAEAFEARSKIRLQDLRTPSGVCVPNPSEAEMQTVGCQSCKDALPIHHRVHEEA